MQLHQLKGPKGARKKRKIVGRGRGSGSGKTSGRGEKGQNARSTGHATFTGYEGGQMRLIRRLPKVGFNSHRPILNQVVNVEDLNRFDKGTLVNADSLKVKGLIKSLNKPIKILGQGELKHSLTVQIESISKSAREKIEKAGGKVEVPVIKNEQSKDGSK